MPLKSHVISLWGHSISCAFYTSRRKKWRADSTWVSSILTAVIHYQALIFAVYWTSVRAWCLCGNWKVYRVWSVFYIGCIRNVTRDLQSKETLICLAKDLQTRQPLQASKEALIPLQVKYTVFFWCFLHAPEYARYYVCVCLLIQCHGNSEHALILLPYSMLLLTVLLLSQDVLHML